MKISFSLALALTCVFALLFHAHSFRLMNFLAQNDDKPELELAAFEADDFFEDNGGSGGSFIPLSSLLPNSSRNPSTMTPTATTTKSSGVKPTTMTSPTLKPTTMTSPTLKPTTMTSPTLKPTTTPWVPHSLSIQPRSLSTTNPTTTTTSIYFSSEEPSPTTEPHTTVTSIPTTTKIKESTASVEASAKPTSSGDASAEPTTSVEHPYQSELPFVSSEVPFVSSEVPFVSDGGHDHMVVKPTKKVSTSESGTPEARKLQIKQSFDKKVISATTGTPASSTRSDPKASDTGVNVSQGFDKRNAASTASSLDAPMFAILAAVLALMKWM